MDCMLYGYSALYGVHTVKPCVLAVWAPYSAVWIHTAAKSIQPYNAPRAPRSRVLVITRPQAGCGPRDARGQTRASTGCDGRGTAWDGVGRRGTAWDDLRAPGLELAGRRHGANRGVGRTGCGHACVHTARRSIQHHTVHTARCIHTAYSPYSHTAIQPALRLRLR